MPAIHALIFDLDGTLVNSLDDLADATNRTLKGAGYPVHPVNDYRYFVGNGLKVLLQRALPVHAPTEGPVFDALLERLRLSYDAHWNDKSRPYAGIAALLDQLAARCIPMAVLSNKPDNWTGIIVRHYFPHTPFAVIRGALPGVPHKPDPQAALQVAAILGQPPASIAFVGDSNVDIKTGVNAGMFPVGVTWGFRDEAELREAGAAAIIHQPDEVLGILG